VVYHILKRIFGSQPSEEAGPERKRLRYETMPPAIYAIGDIHGCYSALQALETKLIADASKIEGEKWFVYLGDYIDRGPSSATVIGHLLKPSPPGIHRVCLAGNHEEIALEALTRGDASNGWLTFGGLATLASYGILEPATGREAFRDQLLSHIPQAHIDFLASLPSAMAVPGFWFTHAGANPERRFEDQSERDLLWSRPSDFKWPEAGIGARIVHGHTPVREVDLTQDRINIDLGAYATGVLCCLRILADGTCSVIVND
jgi:serine/threonine protein phosphatase 1